MKLLRFGEVGKEKPGILDRNGGIRDLSAVTPDFGKEHISHEAISRLRDIDVSTLPEISGNPRIGAIVNDVPNFYFFYKGGCNVQRGSSIVVAKIVIFSFS